MGLLEWAKKKNKEYASDSLAQIANVVPNYRRLKTSALGMDYPLYGGLPYGRICVYSGKQHSGKTTAAWAELAAYQKENPDKVCLFVDAEQALDLQFQALMNDVDLTKLIIIQPEEGMSGEQVLDLILDAQLNNDDIGLIVLDSIPALVSAQNLKSEFTKDTGRQGTIAKPLHKFCGEMLPSLRKKQNILILINQVRIAGTLPNGAVQYSEPGGDAPKFYSSVSVRFGTRTFMKGEDEIKGENAGDGADGFRLKFTITKNKTAACNRGGGFITYRYETGMDEMNDMLSIALSFDFIRRVNNVTYELIDLETGELFTDENGELLRGKKKDLIAYINSHADFKKRYRDMLVNFISAKNTQVGNDPKLLSEEEEKEIALEQANTKEVD